ncbi:MAG: Spy/CpxP family protein refolding chaperone [Bacteroidales bacterium]|nr:Spy/CpxP family protein refolding chaperone [Bacteroidales bacterium]
MKSKMFKKLSLLILIALLSLNINSYAQKRGMNNRSDRGRMYKNELQYNQKALNLTDEQAAKIKDIKLAYQKETLPLKNLLNEKRAHLKTLMTAEKADMKAINKIIDEMSTIRTKMMKKRVENRQKIRNLLTDEQKIIFDTRPQRKNFGRKNYMHECFYNQRERMGKPGPKNF